MRPPAKAVAGASGRAQFSVSQALLTRADLGVIGRDLFSLLPSKDKAERSRQVHCAVLRVSLAGGTGTVLTIVDTPGASLAGGGSLDLEALSADVLLKPRPRRASLGAVKTPIRISGPFDALRVAVDKSELAKTTAKALGFALLNPLGALVDLGVSIAPWVSSWQRTIRQRRGRLPGLRSRARTRRAPRCRDRSLEAEGQGRASEGRWAAPDARAP
jgi:hypothetical protein